ncbi:MAG: hypothetical protein ACYC1Q_07810 [Bacteroidia bacterium]
MVPGTEPEFKIHATAQRYVAALGKGRGVLFHVYFNEPDSLSYSAFTLDSLVVHGKKIPATWTEQGNKPVVEGNYFVAEQEPEPGKVPEPSVNTADPVLYFSDYLPATLYFHYQRKHYAIPITHFESLSE